MFRCGKPFVAARMALFVVTLHLCVGSSGVLFAQDAGPERDPVFAAWMEVEEGFQSEGTAPSLALSRLAVRRYPSSLGLSMQYARILVARSGFEQAQVALDTLRVEGFPTSTLLAADISLAIERGEDAQLVQLLGDLRRSPGYEVPSQSWDGLILLLLDAAMSSRSTLTLTPADSLLQLASNHSLVQDASGFAAGFLELRLERERAGRVLRSLGPGASIPQFEELVGHARQGGYDAFALRTAFTLGRLQLAIGASGAAEATLRAALPWSQQLEDRRHEALLYNYLGRCLQEQNRNAEARENLRIAAELLEGQGDPVASAWCRLGLGWSEYVMGSPSGAEPELQLALEYFQETHDNFGSFHALNNLGLVALFSERTDIAETYFDEALALVRGTQLEFLAPLALNNQAILYQRTARPDRATEVYRQLLEHHRANGDLASELRTLNNLGLVTEQLGRIREARILFEQVIERGEQQDNYVDASAHINLGRMMIQEGDYEDARIQLEMARQRALASGDAHYIIDAREALGLCLERMGQTDSALEQWSIADRERVRLEQSYSRLMGLLRMARLHSKLEQDERALACVATVESLSVLLGNERFLAASYAERADLWLKAGAWEDAGEESRLALELLDPSRWEQDLPARRHERKVFYRALSSLVRAGLAEEREMSAALIAESFALAQRLKSRSLLEYLQEGQRPILPDIPEALAEEERQLRRGVDETRTALTDATFTRAQRDSLQGNLAEMITRHQLLRAKILSSDARFERAALRPQLTLNNARSRLLREETLILDFLLPPDDPDFADEPALVFALHEGGSDLYLLTELPRLRSQVDLAVQLLGARPNSVRDLDALRRILRELSTLLLGPVAAQVQASRDLLVCPDGFLQRLPFAALPNPGDPPYGPYLVETHATTVALSLASVAASRGMATDQLSAEAQAARPGSSEAASWHPRWDLNVWQGYYDATDEATVSTTRSAPELPPLPQADAERHFLQRSFDDTHAQVLSRDSFEDAASAAPAVEGSPALPATTLPGAQSLGQSRILHFIAHGYFDDLQPWRSGLYLWQHENQTRKLEIADVYTLDFRCDLVTLSSCQSAREDLGASLGLQGFTQALFASGARSVLASLWDIQDQSAPRFMRSFYDALADGETKAQALRRTQLAFLDDPELRHPFFWAPYILQGDGTDTIPLTRRTLALDSRLLALAGLLTLVALFCAWMWRRASRTH